MPLTVGNGAEREMLRRIIGVGLGGAYAALQGDTLRLHLYKGGRAIAEGDSKFGLIASNGAGYNYIPLAPASWTVNTPNIATGDTTIAAYAQQTFTYTGADSVAGYYVMTVRTRNPQATASDSILMWREAFNDGPYIVPAGGGTIKVTLRIALD
jgi:hypothetical protein